MIGRAADTLIDYFTNMRIEVIPDPDKEIIRNYADRVKEISLQKEQATKRKLWYDHNDLKTTEPVIMCDPEHGWYEVILESDLECTSELARKIEWVLKREIFWAEELKDDRPIEATFSVPLLYEETGWGFNVIEASNHGSSAYHIDVLMKSYEEMDKLKNCEIRIDYKNSDRFFEIIHDAFGDILEVKRSTKWWWSIATKRGITDTFAFLRGMENMMMDMYLEPDNFKKVMEFLMKGNLQFLDYLESNALLTPNNDGSYICSGGLGYTNALQPDRIGTKLMDMWGFSESQMTSDVSPDMFEEFIFPYQLPLLEKFGLNGYGCCEGLNNKWHIIQRIPRLRRVSVSNWANHAVMAELLQDKYIYSSKPNPSPLATSKMNQDLIRNWAKEEAKLTKNCVAEIIMKDNHTIANNPQNLIDWCRIMKEEFK